MRSALRVLTLTFILSAATAPAALAAPIFNAGNGHWYDFIGTGGTWAQALDAADDLSHLGLAGYLVTITDGAEQAFLNANYGGSGLYWIGHSDQGSEGTWRYAAGPENGNVAVYANWFSGEPNDCCAGEDFAVANWGLVGTWNDLGSFDQVGGYVVEYSARQVVPEPATLSLLGFGLAAAGRQIRRRRSRQ